ncbi:MAG TPA: homocysteine S-methyltransferase [Actinomycetes bacterium]|nr:homocysteine S-methyltransferase [Actinomycetes bacterium]
MSSLHDEFQHGPLLLDGGLATELERQGTDISGRLWSARLLRDDPAAIVAAHRAFFEAGADIAITASYQATFEGFAAVGIDNQTTAELMRLSVELARRAAAEIKDRPTWVAASVGPYGAMLADGSEYRGDYGLTVKQLREFHRPRLEALSASGADILAVETIPCAAEVEALLTEVAVLPIQAWFSLTVTGDRTRAGEDLRDVFAMTADVEQVVAVGVNCSTPEDINPAVQLAVAASKKPAVAYPNSGEGWNADQRAWGGISELHVASASEWIGSGARLVGGCCRVTPTQIRDMAAVVRRTDTSPL